MPKTDKIPVDYPEIVKQFQNFITIGIALSAEKDRLKLLEMILTETRRVCNADAGTLYMVEEDKLSIQVLHNQKLNIFQGGKRETITIPPVPLKPEYVAGYVGLTGRSVNIPDIYTSQEFDFSGALQYDKITGYCSVSMLVIPLKNYSGEVIGVLQLLNALNDKAKIIPFDPIYQTVIESLSSLAAIALSNMKLVREIEDLFESFVQVMVTAIDARTPYNATHTQNVSKIALLIAGEINLEQTGTFAEEFFDEERLTQLSMSAWLHDIGKVATPLEVMNKATRLDYRLPGVLQRLDYAILQAKYESLEHKMRLPQSEHEKDSAKEEAKYQKRLEELTKAKELIIAVNNPAYAIDTKTKQQIMALNKITYRESDGSVAPLITPEELACLLIPRGTLTEDERKIMEDHVSVAEKMLSKIPFTKELVSVPEFACMHHEYLDGSGYPHQLQMNEIPLEARILAVADIYDALTASDRPYRKALPLEIALDILKKMGQEGKLDPDIIALFIRNKTWEKMNV